ncbi:MAG: beta strand repeat-containing protein, partial [Terracidiphilus sp.]
MLLASWLSRRIVAFGSNPHRLPSLLRRGASAWFWALVAVCLLAGAAQARAQHTLIVNTLADSLNGSTNCVNGTLICSLRDAITQADLDSGDIIDFSPSVTGVITLSALGSLPQITAPVTINGPTGGAPSEVTVDGANTYQVLTVGSSVAVTISNLAIRNGYDTTGGGIDNYGNLILIGDTLYDNVAASATGVGGGVYSEGATAQLTVIDGTFYGNTADVGGAIYSLLGKLTVEESTIYGNSASTGTGGIVNFGGTVSVANSIVDFNTVVTTVGTKSYQDINNLSGGTCNNSSDGTCNTSSAYGNVLGILGPSASKEPVALPISTLGFWGGTTETLLPLPSSSAICGGLSASKFLTATGSTLASTDQRGSSRTTTYTPANSSVTSSTTCVDAGAVQTNFSIAWSVQPPATVGQSETMTPAPAVQLDESGVPWIDPGESTIGVGMSLTGVGSLTNSAAQVTPATGVATFGNLSVNEVGGPDYLTAILKLTASGTTPAVKLYTPRSDPFQVVPSVTQLVFATPPATPVVLNGNAGTVVINEEDSNGNVVTGALDAVALTVTGPSGSGYSASYTATAVNGVATINLSAVPLTFVGTYTYTATDVSYPTVTSAVATEKVGEAASGLVGPSTTQTFAYGEGGSIPITVTGQTGIASPGGNISYTIGSGTSQTAAITAITPPSTPPSGGAAITVPASLAAGTYTVTVNYGGDSKYNGATAVSFTLIVAQASSTIGHLPNATFAYGTGGTIPVTVTGQYSGAGIATPSGNITYNLGNGVIYTAAITSGDATLTVPATLPPGTYTATVSYAGDSNYDAATAVSFNLTIGSATLTISANNATKPYGAPNPTFTGSVTGAAASDTFSETFTTGATASSPVGTYPITPSVTGANLADYTVVANNGTLTVAQASSTIGHLSNASLAYGAGGTIPVTVAGQYSGAGIATPGGNITYNLGNGVIYTAA